MSCILGVVSDRIYVSFKPVTIVSGLLLCYGRVVYAGDAGVVEKTVSVLGGELVDYGSYTVMPGFIDAHLHLDSLSLQDLILDLRNTRSVREILEKIREHVSRNPSTPFIVGRGWDQDKLLEKKPPTRRELDEIVPDKPVMLVRICGHMAVVNTKTLEKTGVVTGENVDYEKGFVYEEKVGEIWRSLGLEEYALRNIASKQKELAGKGITRIGWVSAKTIHPLTITQTIKIRYYLSPKDFTAWLEKNLPPGTLSVDGVKILLDGSLGARTAYLSKPYSDDPGNTGKINYDENKLEEIVKHAVSRKYHVAVHAIGDKALDTILGVYNKLGVHGERIEHASLVRDDQIPLLRRLGVKLVVQPGFILSDTWILDRLGKERIRWTYRIKSLLDHEITIGFSSDAPVEPPDPWRNIYAAITRGENEGLDIAYYTREEKIDVATAIHLHTKGSAETLYMNNVGELKPGYTGDYIVVDENPLELEPHELLKTRVVETRVEGEKIYP